MKANFFFMKNDKNLKIVFFERPWTITQHCFIII